MNTTIIKPTHTRGTLILGAVWALFWLLPWRRLPTVQAGNLLALLTDSLRLGLALLLFLVPGLLLYLLLTPKKAAAHRSAGLPSISMTLALALISTLGLIGRLTGLSFVWVKSLYFLVGVVLFGASAVWRVPLFSLIQQLSDSSRKVLKNPPLLAALIVAFILTFNPNLFFIDDGSYLAYLTNWQHATQLGFSNLIHEVAVVEHSRFWLALFPMSQALLADLSGVPGILLLGSYLELFLVPLAVLTGYWFARRLGLSTRAAGFAVLFQVSLYAWMVGYFLPVGLWFYRNLAEDKVFAVFILTPVYLTFALDFIKRRSLAKGVLVFLAGLSIFLTHPIILFYSSSIMLCMGILAWLSRQTTWREVLLLVIVVIALFLPYLYVRDQAGLENSTNDVNLVDSQQIDLFGRTFEVQFYGLNPELLKFSVLDLPKGGWNTFYQIFRMIPIFIALAAGVIAAFNLKKGPLYWVVFTTALLIVVVTVPYTGWIVGTFIPPRMLSRSSWYSPLGLGSVLIAVTFVKWLRARKPQDHTRRRIPNSALGMIACVLFPLPIIASVILPGMPAYFSNISYYKQLAQVGTYIDQQSPTPVMVIGLDYEDTQFLPGVSAQARLIYFREQNVNPHSNFMTTEERRTRIEETEILRSFSSEQNQQRCQIIEHYGLRFVLAREEQFAPFQEEVRACDKTASLVFSTPDLFLFEIGE